MKRCARLFRGASGILRRTEKRTPARAVTRAGVTANPSAGSECAMGKPCDCSEWPSRAADAKGDPRRSQKIHKAARPRESGAFAPAARLTVTSSQDVRAARLSPSPRCDAFGPRASARPLHEGGAHRATRSLTRTLAPRPAARPEAFDTSEITGPDRCGDETGRPLRTRHGHAPVRRSRISSRGSGHHDREKNNEAL